MDTTTALVLAGGNALGAYHAGVVTALHTAGITPNWVAGSSIGAVTAAIVAGNPPDQVVPALQRFWDQSAAYDFGALLLPQPLRDAVQYGQALTSRLFGRQPLFTLRANLFDPARPGQFSAAPMRRLLSELVDIDRLNSGQTRLAILAVDLRTGQQVVFDTAQRRVELDHIIASAGLIPDFQPIEIDGRLLVDGGLSANLPLHLVLQPPLEHPRADRLTCFASDLFPLAAPLPRTLPQAAQRESDLIFASQSSRLLHALTNQWQDQTPGADVILTAYQALDSETALKSYDFTSGTLTRRREAGLADMTALIAQFRAAPTSAPGLTIHAAPS